MRQGCLLRSEISPSENKDIYNAPRDLYHHVGGNWPTTIMLRVLLFCVLGLHGQAYSQSFAGQVYLFTEDYSADNCEILNRCDCCGTDLVFLKENKFLMIDLCEFDNTYSAGTYVRTKNKMNLVFKQKYVDEHSDEVTKKSTYKTREVKLESLEFDIRLCGKDKIMLEHPTIKKFSHGGRRPADLEKQYIMEMKVESIPLKMLWE